ncbi:MAG: NADH-quinone oxidoreductase subunit NuoF [Verrucomicrobia bacterium]|nr:NADH-quinone oxidoreductase subunit NuoF [Verrucomicrobiota bacterium]
MAAAERKILTARMTQPGYSVRIEDYLAAGGYAALKKALAMKPEDIRAEVTRSGLRGRGGAGFGTGLKWSLVDRKSSKPIYLICNADEAEPGTFKDRQIIHRDPHALIEGIVCASYANDVRTAYIYVRGEFAQGYKILLAAIEEARAKNFVGRNILGSAYSLEIFVHRGAGAYICGEETGLIESLEGKRGYPRFKPPYFPAVLGLWMCPTIVNNVETLANIPVIIQMGGAEFAHIGTPGNTGTRMVGVSGHVNKPGCYEVELGKITYGELINGLCGGVPGGRKVKAIIPGGSSAKIIRCDERFKGKKRDGTAYDWGWQDVPVDFDSLPLVGTMAGSGGVIVLDETTDMPKAIANIAEFYAHESCGQCTPCREGSLWMAKALHRMTHGHGQKGDTDYLKGIADNIPGRTICPFGEACAWPVQSFVEKFRDDFVKLEK